MRWFDSVTDSVNINLGKLKERDIVKDGGGWHAAIHETQRVGHHLETEKQ